ncbi:hypothetical protein [Alkalinema sp. FACHB-956]|uniref:hypothetical protein n=1 Tax=Alkalinema sp. FACHB-956 TaxID=2692768 RepID=UPI0016883772|nr:hypothetical protein [Alkalinema sp. FACHB-956]MBD2328303.1 hypothetical protein [Alkalinema sp. FACHB-956]
MWQRLAIAGAFLGVMGLGVRPAISEPLPQSPKIEPTIAPEANSVADPFHPPINNSDPSSPNQLTNKSDSKGDSKAILPNKATNPANESNSIAALQPDVTPFNIKQLNQGLCESSIPGVRDLIDFQPNLSLPSLWLARDQFAAQAKFGSKLLEGWLACPRNAIAQPKVSVIINEQLWSLLDYLERYQFLNQFGTAAQQEGFNLRLFSRQGNLLAAYTCAVPGRTEPTSDGQRPCAMQLDALGRGSVRGRSNGLFGSIPTSGGIAQP